MGPEQAQRGAWSRRLVFGEGAEGPVAITAVICSTNVQFSLLSFP